ncbi:hypothetical protein LNTAR_21645 [Lentisphaera araneosa HTCC2155]|uniref:Uncharacterized protein n=1 Tax=Lentisphaera araneosa HTCC2155 TaxID=313628 RepID=A6DM63_9BACT|nr:hypothetical protein [Lentisphaera araneosa]EDM27361.1 hypothetical protein LNTAR_21645 [Lentisphaera araneosa HTCC2155]
MNKSAAIINNQTNCSVVQMPDRKFPGIVLQGDSLNIIYSNLMKVLEQTEGKISKEEFLIILEQAELIEGYLNQYEKSLDESSIELPYSKSFNKTTKDYKHYWE